MPRLIVATSAALVLFAAGAAEAQAPVDAVARFHREVVSHTSLGGFRGATESWRVQIALTRTRKVIGAGYVSCIRMSPTVRNCYANYSLPEGTMVALGLVGNMDRFSLTIAGGTGAYLDYQGWVAVRDQDIVFHLHKLSGP